MKNLFFIYFLVYVSFAAFPAVSYAQRKTLRERKDEKENDPGRRFARALLNLRNDKPDAALSTLRENVEEFPIHWPSWLLMALIEYRQNHFQESKKAVLHSLKINPNSKTANLLAADLFSRENKALKASQFYRNAGKGDPSDEREMNFTESQITEMKARLEESKKLKSTSSLKFYSARKEDRSENLFASLSPIDVARQIKLAVLSFQHASADTSKTRQSETLTEMMTTAMAQTCYYKVVERQQLSSILAEQDFELSGAVDQETAAQVGAFIGADAVFIGSWTELGQKTEVDGRLVDIKTGAILCAASAQWSDPQSIRNAVNELAVSLAKATYK